MLRIGLTGNIGSGKTTVARVFNVLGIPVYHADAESKKLLGEPEVTRKIAEKFGHSVISTNGEIDRKILANLIFNNSNNLDWINSLMHPLVIEHFRLWAKEQQAPYVLQEAAIIFESGIAGEFDYIIHVSCPKEIAIHRVTQRDGVDEIGRAHV